MRQILSCLSWFQKYRVFAIAIVLFLISTINFGFAVPTWGVTSSPIAALPIVKDIFAGTPPDNLGVHDGLLASCPQTPNCVVSYYADESHTIAPIIYQSDLDTAKEILLKVLSVVPRTEVIEQTDNYIRAQSTSRLLGFIDDVEFYFPQDKKEIEMRSASRLGESDLGVNRRRLEQIRLAMADLKA